MFLRLFQDLLESCFFALSISRSILVAFPAFCSPGCANEPQACYVSTGDAKVVKVLQTETYLTFTEREKTGSLM